MSAPAQQRRRTSSGPGSGGPDDRGNDEAAPFTPDVQQKLAEWLSQPDPHMELLGGKLSPKAMAKGPHGSAQGTIFSQVVRLNGPGGAWGDGPEPPGPRWWLTQEPDLYIGGEGMRPDVAGWRMDRHPAPPETVNVAPHLGVYVTAPDWTCEVLSKSTQARDRGIKWKAYQRAGVEWYWMVDLLNESLTVYRRNERSYEVVETAGPGEVRRLPPFEQVDFVLSPLFVFKAPPQQP